VEVGPKWQEQKEYVFKVP